MPEKRIDHVVETGFAARAGVTGRHARTVLVVSTASLCLLFFGVYLYFFV